MSDREVVLTGFGIVSPIGIGKDACYESLHNQQSGAAPVQAFDGSTSRCAIAAEVCGFEPKQYVRPRKSLKVMSRDIQLAFATVRLNGPPSHQSIRHFFLGITSRSVLKTRRT